jgi:hypothetical protein
MTPEDKTNEEVVLPEVEEIIDEFIKTIPDYEFLPNTSKDDSLPF